MRGPGMTIFEWRKYLYYFLFFNKKISQGSGPLAPTCQMGPSLTGPAPPTLPRSPIHVEKCGTCRRRPVSGAVAQQRRRQTCQNQVQLIDAPPDGHIRTASRPHIATIFYPPISTTHFYLLITWLIHSNIPKWLIPNLDKTQNVILD